MQLEFNFAIRNCLIRQSFHELRYVELLTTTSYLDV